MAVKKKNLKWGVFKSPSVKVNFERYIIENQDDLEAFIKEFPLIEKFGIYNNMAVSLSEGLIIVATDEHPISGFPTYCFETHEDEDEDEDIHPTAIIRVKLGEIE